MGRYLYTNKYGVVSRFNITRETEHTIWIEINKLPNGQINETRINKKTMTTGSGWHTTRYYEETESLISRYDDRLLDYKFNKALKFLELKQSNETKQTIIEIVENLRKEKEANNG